MEVLKEIGKILAEGVKNDPYLAAITLLVLIAAATLIHLRAEKKLPWFFGLVAVAICAVVLIARTEVNRQKERLTMLPSVQTAANPNAVPIIDQLTENQKEDIRKILGKAAEDAANALGIPSHLIRANVFSPDEHEKLRIIKQLTHNMDRLEELEISIPVGKGSTGRSFLSGQPNIAVFNEGWGPNTPGELEIPKVHPDLQWIISVPVKGKTELTRPIWIMNIDCLKERRDETQLRSALSHLYPWSYTISLIISQAQQTVFRKPADTSLKPVEAYRVTIENGATVERKEEINTLVKDIQISDVPAATKRFVRSMAEIGSLPSLNSFTKHEFDKQVQDHFVSDETLK